ncbi:hypothetical protein LEP1GSC125_3359 [Leptospira mayottensis 200901122]|uniref:Uncharacterized protein n=1 Tax=Leptospira mayottensis 200901122 TaxID=1193010 RepID=A0AA87MPX5_9LEPT|nr:hypothetical protein LEP1GSC125_3359 [Leptospira mayottensis 200901122]
MKIPAFMQKFIFDFRIIFIRRHNLEFVPKPQNIGTSNENLTIIKYTRKLLNY